MDEAPDLFEIICQYKDTNPSNLNKRFEAYGTNTLETSVPVVEAPVVERLQRVSPEQQMYATMALKTRAANMAMDGRPSRTRNRTLKVVDVGNQTVLATGQERERSPVDRGVLDDELEKYAQERSRLIAMKKGVKMEVDQTPTTTKVPAQQASKLKREKPTETTNDDKDDAQENTAQTADALNNDLERYMEEARRIREQKKRLVELTEREEAMMCMEE